MEKVNFEERREKLRKEIGSIEDQISKLNAAINSNVQRRLVLLGKLELVEEVLREKESKDKGNTSSGVAGNKEPQ